MFRWLFKRRVPKKIGIQPIGEIFPWKGGMILKAVDTVTIAFPRALLGENEVIGSVFSCNDDDAEFGFQDNQQLIVVRLKPGMELSVSKSCQAVVLAEFDGDTKPKRLEVAN